MRLAVRYQTDTDRNTKPVINAFRIRGIMPSLQGARKDFDSFTEALKTGTAHGNFSAHQKEDSLPPAIILTSG